MFSSKPSQPGPPEFRSSHGAVLRIVLPFAVFSALWILSSDRVLAWLLQDPHQMAMASTLKGFVYVLGSSMLLYFLIRRGAPSEADASSRLEGHRSLFLPGFLIGVTILALVAGGVFHSVRNVRERESARIHAVADARSRMVSDWIKDRNDRALFLQRDPLFVHALRTFLSSPQGPEKSSLQHYLDERSRIGGIKRTFLLGLDGRFLLGSSGSPVEMEPGIREAAIRSAREGRIEWHGPHPSRDGALQLNQILPLPDADGRVAAVMVLHNDPRENLFLALHSWLVPSQTGETLLFRKEGDSILFLSDLRHLPERSDRLRLPLSQRHLLAVKMVQGRASAGALTEGIDYRGHRVLGVIRPIPGTDWYLVAKQDRSEVYSGIWIEAMWIALSGIVTFFAAFAGLVILRQNHLLQASLQEQLHQQEKLHALDLLQAVAETSKDVIFVKDTQGRYLLFNREASRLMGKRMEDVLGSDDSVLFPPDQAERVMSMDREILEQMQVVTFQETLTTAEGERVFLVTKGPLRNRMGDLVGIYGISRDITTRNQAETDLRESERRFRNLFDHMVEGLAHCQMVYDAEGRPIDFLYLDVNPAFERLTGLKDVVGKRVSEVIPGRTRENHPELFDFYDRIASGGSPCKVETSVNELGIWLGQSVYSPARGQFISVFDNITERKHATMALKESEERLRLALAATRTGVWEWNLQTQQVYWSQECYGILGAGPFDGTLKGFTDLVHGDSRRILENALRQACDQGIPYDLELEMVTQMDRRKFVRSIGIPVSEGNRVIKLRGSIQDITERVESAQARDQLQSQLNQVQKMDSIGRLAGGVAHDFNNMLGVILGHAELALMRSKEPSSPIRKDLLEIQKAAHRSAGLTRQLLAFARKQTVVPKVLDLNETLTGMHKMLERLVGEDIDLQWNRKEGLWKLKIDPSQVDQILANLVVNARDAIRGTGRIQIELGNCNLDEEFCNAHAGSRPGEHVAIRVQDDGCGMTPEVLEHLFEPFFTTKGPGEGTGLGLATIYGIVKQNDGYIGVVSAPGEGTTFTVYLPRYVVYAEPASLPAVDEVAQAQGETVLVVEDEAAHLNIVEEMLRSLGYKVLAAVTPDAAVSLATTHPGNIDLLLTDVVMPGMNGRDLARAIQGIRPSVKCLFMSGYTADFIAHRGVLENGLHYLAKPFNFRELAERLRNVLT